VEHKNETILVTGGAGNIGSSLVNALSADLHRHVVVVDSLLTGSRHKLPGNRPNVTFIKCDVNEWSDISCLFFRYHFDYVFHYAAVVGVQRTLEHPLLVLKDVRGIENVLSLSKNTGVRRVFYSSSSEVYGEPTQIPQNELTTPLNSRLPYAIVKNIGESYFKTYQREFGLPFTIFRFFNTYGPNQSDDFVLPRFVSKAIAGEDIPIYGDGSQRRTFIYVGDTTEICMKCLTDDLFVNDVINIGSDIELSILELAQKVIAITGSSSRIIFLPPLPEGDMTRRLPDISKVRAYKQDFVSLDQGIRLLADHYRNAHRS
jgi:UDP-glucose 4-epimerase